MVEIVLKCAKCEVLLEGEFSPFLSNVLEIKPCEYCIETAENAIEESWWEDYKEKSNG